MEAKVFLLESGTGLFHVALSAHRSDNEADALCGKRVHVAFSWSGENYPKRTAEYGTKVEDCPECVKLVHGRKKTERMSDLDFGRLGSPSYRTTPEGDAHWELFLEARRARMAEAVLQERVKELEGNEKP